VKHLKILVIDDNQAFCAGMERVFRAQGYTRIFSVHYPSQALEAIKRDHPDLIFLDLNLPGMDGLQLLTAIRKISKNIRTIMLTCEASEECEEAAVNLGALDYLVKPIEISALCASLEERLSA
jgi:DNA-binding response OmpR family regulator